MIFKVTKALQAKNKILLLTSAILPVTGIKTFKYTYHQNMIQTKYSSSVTLTLIFIPESFNVTDSYSNNNDHNKTVFSVGNTISFKRFSLQSNKLIEMSVSEFIQLCCQLFMYKATRQGQMHAQGQILIITLMS